MRNFERRVKALEGGGEAGIPPAAKEWLGWDLTEAESAALDAPADTAPIDTSTWSQELKTWLGVD